MLKNNGCETVLEVSMLMSTQLAEESNAIIVLPILTVSS